MIGITEYIANILNADGHSLEEQYTRELQADATAADWPVIVTVQLSVILRKGHYTVEYPDSVREQIEILEFGTETVPPSPVIRNFMAKLAQRERAA